MSILDRIIAEKDRELERLRLQPPNLEEASDAPPPPSFEEALRKPSVNIIAEIKYHSPSHGDFLCRLPPVEVASRYVEAGAAAISVLTDAQFFKGDLGYLGEIHQEQPSVPLLRKDFILDRLQLIEARIAGASAVLLIAACLRRPILRQLIVLAPEMGLQSLVEVHDAYELETALESGAKMIGVNNRNLKTFQVDLQTSFDLARRLENESGFLLVSESGITEPAQIEELRDAGFSAFLVGSYFMDSKDPGERLAQLMESSKSKTP